MGLVVQLIQLIFFALEIAVLLRVLFSYIQPSPYNPLVRFIYAITEPILAPIRRVIPPLGMFDITPMVALIILAIIQRLLLSLLL